MSAGLLGAMSGLGKGMAEVGDGMIKQDAEIAREERSLILNQKLLQNKDDMEEAKRMRVAGRIRDLSKTADEASTVENYRKFNGETADMSIGTADMAPEELAQFKPTGQQKERGLLNAGMESGELGIKDVLTLNRQDAANDVATRKLDLTEMQMLAKEALGERRMELDSKKLDAMISGIGAWAKSSGAGKGQTTAMIQNWAELERRGYPQEEIKKMLFEGKMPQDKTTVTDDGFGGKKTSSTSYGDAPANGQGATYKYINGKLVPN